MATWILSANKLLKWCEREDLNLHTLAGIAKVLRKEEFLRGLDDAQDAAAIMQVIQQHSLPR